MTSFQVNITIFCVTVTVIDIAAYALPNDRVIYILYVVQIYATINVIIVIVCIDVNVSIIHLLLFI